MPASDVDRAAIAEFVERDLQRGIPASCSQLADHSIDEGSVCFVEQPIQGLAAPSNPHVEVSAERLADTLKAIEIRMP
jgi:hypothetical protein